VEGGEAGGLDGHPSPAQEGGKRRSDSSEASRGTAASEWQAVLERADAALEALVPGHSSLQVSPPLLQSTARFPRLKGAKMRHLQGPLREGGP